MTPQVGEKIINEKGQVCEIIERIGNQFRCKCESGISSSITHYERYYIDEIWPNKMGEFWMLTHEAVQKRKKT